MFYPFSKKREMSRIPDSHIRINNTPIDVSRPVAKIYTHMQLERRGEAEKLSLLHQIEEQHFGLSLEKRQELITWAGSIIPKAIVEYMNSTVGLFCPSFGCFVGDGMLVQNTKSVRFALYKDLKKDWQIGILSIGIETGNIRILAVSKGGE